MIVRAAILGVGIAATVAVANRMARLVRLGLREQIDNVNLRARGRIVDRCVQRLLLLLLLLLRR